MHISDEGIRILQCAKKTPNRKNLCSYEAAASQKNHFKSIGCTNICASPSMSVWMSIINSYHKEFARKSGLRDSIDFGAHSHRSLFVLSQRVQEL